MKTMSRAIATGILAVTMAACSADIAPPDVPPTYTGEAPAIRDGQYAEYETRRVFNAPLVPLREFIEGEQRIVGAMEETDQIRKPIDVVVVHGEWPQEGAVRRLEFSDGHFAMERVLENDFPTLFRYQVWNYTSAAGQNLDYALGQQAWRELPDGRSELVWTYRLKPNAWYKHHFIQQFVSNDMRPLMDNALDTVVEQAHAHFGGE